MKSVKYIVAVLAIGFMAFHANAFGGYGSWSDHPSPNPGAPWSKPPNPGNSPDDADALACLSAIASQNPVLILEACDLLGADGDGPMEQVRMGDPDGEMNEMWCHGDCPTP